MAKGSVILREYPSEGRPQLREVKESSPKLMREVVWSNVDEQLAQDKLFYKNYHVVELKDKFPNHPKAWIVDKYYPYAIGGPLYLDKPTRVEWVNKEYKELMIAKEQFLKETKKRYLRFDEGMTLMDAKERLVK